MGQCCTRIFGGDWFYNRTYIEYFYFFSIIGSPLTAVSCTFKATIFGFGVKTYRSINNAEYHIFDLFLFIYFLYNDFSIVV